MTIGVHSGGQHADFRCHVENVRDAGGHDETVGHLALRDDDGGVGTAEGDAGKTRGGGGSLEGVLHLVESTLGGKDGDVMIVVAVARHGGGKVVVVAAFGSKMNQSMTN